MEAEAEEEVAAELLPSRFKTSWIFMLSGILLLLTNLPVRVESCMTGELEDGGRISMMKSQFTPFFEEKSHL